MKKNKGFTLMELIGVIVIIGIVLGIAVPRIAEYMKKGTNEYYYSLEKEMKFSGMDYTETYRSLLPKRINNVTVINLEELENNKYIDEVKDEEGNKCTGRVTIKKVKADGYEYYSCLECGSNYNSSGQACEYDERDNEYVGGDKYEVGIGGEDSCDLNCTINCDNNNDGVCDRNCDTDNDGKCELNCDNNKDCKCDLNCDTNGDGECDKNCDDDDDGICDRNCDDGSEDIIVGGYVRIEQGKKYELPLGDIYYDGELLEEKITPSPNKIDTDKLGKTTVVYYYHGVKKELIVEVVDATKPSKPEIVLKYDNSKGSSYLGEWYSGKIYQQYKSTDYTKKGVLGSGIKEYQISTDNKNFTSLDSNYQISTENGSYKYYVRSVDNNNNISDTNSYIYKIDTEIPTCELEVKEGTKTNYSTKWYTSDVTIGFKNITETVSSIKTQIIDITSITKNVEDQVVTGIVTDQAGNTSTCSITVSVDKDPPTISAKASPTYINIGATNSVLNHFNINYSISRGSTTCTTNNNGTPKEFTTVNQLSYGINSITCITTGGNGKQVSTTTLFRHKYTAKGNCNYNGVVVDNARCYYEKNKSICGETCHYGCDSCWSSCAYTENTCSPGYTNVCEKYGTYNCGYYYTNDPSCDGCDSNGWTDCDGQPYACNWANKTCTNYNKCTQYQWSSCATGSASECQSGYVDCNCSSCYTKTVNSCNKTDSAYLYYTCPTSGIDVRTGGSISPSLSKTTCSF